MIRNYLSVFILGLLLSIKFTANAQEEKYIGLFTYNFTKYFDWPENKKTGDFIVVVIGHPSVYDELVKISAGKKVGNQNIVIKNYNSLENLGACHIIFVGHWHSRYITDVVSKVGTTPTLIISEMEGLLDKGSAINFVIREGTIKFEMKTSNILKYQLKVDPRIRELAYKVVD